MLTYCRQMRPTEPEKIEGRNAKSDHLKKHLKEGFSETKESRRQAMRIGCWNVAGIRACLKKGAFDWLLEENANYDVFCMQETKAEPHQVEPLLDERLKEAFPYRYWRSCTGEGGQRKGLNGTAIWSKVKPIREIDPPEERGEGCPLYKEGRVTAVEFPEFILVTVYTPNSQSLASDRLLYRVNVWDKLFREYVGGLMKVKPTIVCGDFNVARNDIDVYWPDQVRNMSPGFLNAERNGLELLMGKGMMDAYRWMHPDDEGAYTFWDQKLPYLRKSNRGWRIDYFFVADDLMTRIKACRHHKEILGSDHCPLTLDIRVGHCRSPPRLKIVEN